VYQGSAVGEAETILASIRQLSIGDVVPDLTILLDLDERESMRRVAARGALNRLEQREAAFFARVRAGYLALAQAEPERFLRFDATQSEAALAQEIGQRVLAVLDARLKPG
jgi:dTMP kinase